MKNFIISWGENNDFFSVISTNATKEDVKLLENKLRNKLNNIQIENTNDEYVLEDQYDKTIQKIFHENNFICVILPITDLVML